MMCSLPYPAVVGRWTFWFDDRIDDTATPARFYVMCLLGRQPMGCADVFYLTVIGSLTISFSYSLLAVAGTLMYYVC